MVYDAASPRADRKHVVALRDGWSLDASDIQYHCVAVDHGTVDSRTAVSFVADHERNAHLPK
jgi:hypothetical protein